MRRCIRCRWPIWPWQHFGFRVYAAHVEYWHAAHGAGEEKRDD